MSQSVTVSSARRLTESSIMVAIGTVLSIIKLIDMPYGGSVTLGCMLPVIIIAYRYGVRWGLFTGFVFGVLQQLLGLDNLSYVTTWQSIVAVILLDYIVAYMTVGSGGLFRKMSSQPAALVLGSVMACFLRYICHVISGATVWAGLPIPTQAALVYSIGYNATYMVPEMLTTAILAYYVGSILDLGGENVVHLKRGKKAGIPLPKIIAGLMLAVVALFDVRMIFMHLQNSETGDFDISGYANVHWSLLAIVTVIGVGLAGILLYVYSRNKES